MDLGASGGRRETDELGFRIAEGVAQGKEKVTEKQERVLFRRETHVEKGSMQVQA